MEYYMIYAMRNTGNIILYSCKTLGILYDICHIKHDICHVKHWEYYMIYAM